ncbi:MAG TPA: SlyX family protein [Candidatus Mailhella merdavium]|nr:SlyX family protein [Candidatus Mailhella merdavium]
MDMEERLARLEEQIYFQEHTIQELNDVLFAQQRQLDAMQKTLTEMAERERKLLELVAEKPENSLPPHYMPERY